MGYISNFIVYFCAMIGIIVLALYVYKKFNVTSFSAKRTNSLKIEDALSLSPRKNLYVVRNGKERFLIAADFERTTLISKLEENDEIIHENINRRRYRQADLSEDAILAQNNTAPVKKPIMREIRNRLNF
ncbi:MAG: flagellar biosynthetic protein FliO [Candidatus Gastranaerophilales bacterium]|nr:flagellar biosynthetic protein FliO [Candidatus Gastranaerophilales bacterium]